MENKRSSEQRSQFEFIGMYFAKASQIAVSYTEKDQLLNGPAQKFVKQKFREANALDKFDDFLLVAILSEEFAHFVQHTRGQIGLFEGIPATEHNINRLRIGDKGRKLSFEELLLVKKIMTKVFSEMGYHGNPPAGGVVFLDRFIRISLSPEEAPAYEEYLTQSEYRGHYRTYEYDEQALAIQSKVLNWWFNEVEELPFSITMDELDEMFGPKL